MDLLMSIPEVVYLRWFIVFYITIKIQLPFPMMSRWLAVTRS